ncbi:MAG: lamin tail domain-containing protein [Anaerolineales bacterium]
MQNWNRFPRFLLVLTLLISLCAGMFAPKVQKAEAAPLVAVDKVSVVISEFRTRGANGADDEFVEIYNATGASVTLTNWTIRKSAGCGSVSATPLATINTVLVPGQFYLVGNSTNYSGASPLDAFTGTWSSIADDGGVALLDNLNNIVDQVGLCNTTAYKEGSTLSPFSATTNQSYERKAGGSAGSCKDTDNNSADFIFNSSSSNPQNSTSSPLPCLVVANVSSINGTYTTNQNIDITVTFSNNVNVTGSPTLLLETGLTDRSATYLSGSGTNSLVFRYTVVAGDASGDLDYASANALSLNGGTITGAIGDATLVLPKPGQPGSLGANNAIIVDNAAIPSVLSFQRQTPSAAVTNATTLVFRVTFSEAVTGVDVGDFTIQGSTTATPTLITAVNSNIYNVTVSGGNLATFNGAVGLNLSLTPTIVDLASNSLPAGEPPVDETYTVDHIAPTVVIAQTGSQADPAGVLPVNFTVVFSEPIDVSTLVIADITQSGTASFITWVITDSGDHMNFTLSAVASGNGTIIPSIGAGRVNDLAGNGNSAFAGGCAFPEPNNCVTLTDTTSPAVTINQASTQADPTSTFPINFTVLFSEPINPSVFTASDVTQNGTATGVTWSIANSGDNMTFTLSATTASGFGTVIPFIAANRVTDFAGNNNVASTGTDGSVTYQINTASARAVIINEVAWAGTTSSLTDDEWIELYNPGSAAINITGWALKAADGTPSITLNGTIPAGGYFLLERDTDDTVLDILADQVYASNMDLSNSGEALTLRDGANTVIDTANGNGGAWPKGSASTYGTMERIGTTAESDSTWQTNTGIKRNGKNANNGDILGTPKTSNTPLATPTPTPAKTDTPTPVPTIRPPDPRPIINEILPRPGFDWNQDGKVNVFDEFIEIKNLTAVDLNLNGWKLDDEANIGSAPYTISDITLKPGQRMVFYGLQTNILLSDGGDTVRLISPSGKIYDAYTYTIARAEDASICRLPDGNVYNGWFEDCVPTPNLSNSREGTVPSMPDNGYESPVCQLPDTLPIDFLFAECRGYGANIWNADYWDQPFTSSPRYIPQNTSKWEAIIE